MIGVFIIYESKACIKTFNTFKEAQQYVNMVVHTEVYMFNMSTGDLL